MLVAVLIAVAVLCALVLGWYTWRMFGSFRLEDLTEDRVEHDTLAELTEAHELLKEGVDKLTEELDLTRLPRRWRMSPAPASVRAIGDDWLRAGTALMLKVPSVIVPPESNWLINPAHRDFRRLKVGKPEPFPFDRRLSKP